MIHTCRWQAQWILFTSSTCLDLAPYYSIQPHLQLPQQAPIHRSPNGVASVLVADVDLSGSFPTDGGL